MSSKNVFFFGKAISFSLPGFDTQERKLNLGWWVDVRKTKCLEVSWFECVSSCRVQRVCEEWLQSECCAASDDWCVCLVLNCLGVGTESNVFTSVCVCVCVCVFVCSPLSLSEQFTISMLDTCLHNSLLGHLLACGVSVCMCRRNIWWVCVLCVCVSIANTSTHLSA